MMMKRSLFGWLGTGLLLGTLAVASFAGENCCAPKSAPIKSIQWVEGYEKGLSLAKSQNKVAVMDFYRDGCGWCAQMERKTFRDPAVMKLSKEFVMVKVDGAKERNASIRHEIRGYPTVLMLDGTGKEITRIVGYRRPEDFAVDLKEALAQAKATKETASR
jgi:thiol:disulfide interchange protein DsbD